MKVLVTGGAGFIGSHVVDALVRRGDEATVLDNLSSGTKDNLEHHLKEPSFTFVEGDIMDAGKVREALGGVDAVIHEAAIVSVPFSMENPGLTHTVNVGGTLNLLEMASDAGAKRFVFASSCAVYGEQEKLPISESAPLKPLSPYAESKLAAEKACLKFHRERRIETVVLRYFNIYGPRQTGGDYAGVMVKFKERLLSGAPPIIYGDGEQTRDFIDVRDAARATVQALERDVAGETLNIGTGRSTSINDLCDLFLGVSGRPHLRPVRQPPKAGEIRHSLADIRKAERMLGFRPAVTIDVGVKEFFNT